MNEMTPDEFWSILYSAPEPKSISLRLYYNDDGSPKIYSCDELSDNYIEVDAETYAKAPFNVRVVNNCLVYIDPEVVIKKLQPGQTSGTCCHTTDVCITVTEEQKHTKWSLYD